MTSTLVNEIGRNVQAFLATREQNKQALAAKIQELSAGLHEEVRTKFMSAASQQLAQFTQQVGFQCVPRGAFFVVIFTLVVLLATVGHPRLVILPPIAAMALLFTEQRRRLRYVRDVVLLHRIFDAGRVHRGPLMQLKDATTGIIRTGLVHTVEIILATTGVALLVAGGFHTLAAITIETRNMAPVMAFAGLALILVSTMFRYSIKLHSATAL